MSSSATGASSGIGLELATQLSQRGYDVVGVGSSDRVDTLRQRLSSVEVYPIRADLRTEAGVESVWDEIEQLGRPLDVAALNAGVSLGGAFIDTDIEDEKNMIALNQGLREELREHNVSVTALLPGATVTEFHHRAGMDNTLFGSNDWKNDPELVARRGLDALFADKDHVVGGDLRTRVDALRNRLLPERVKARRFAKASRPST